MPPWLGQSQREVTAFCAGEESNAFGAVGVAGRNVAAVDPVLDVVQLIPLVRNVRCLRPVSPAGMRTIRASV